MEANPNLFINRSVFIHAWQYLPENLSTLENFLEQSNVLGFKTLNDVLYLHIQTPNKEEVNTYSALPGEFLVKDPSGWVEVYPEDNVNKYWVKFSIFLYAKKSNVLS
jgi:hypothetical protein